MRRQPAGRAVSWGRMLLFAAAAALLAVTATVYWPRSLDADLPPPLRVGEMAGLEDAALVERVASDLRWRMARLDADPHGWRGASAPVRNLHALVVGGRMLAHLGVRTFLEQEAVDPDAPKLADLETAADAVPLPDLAAALAAVGKLAGGGLPPPAACASIEPAVRRSLAAAATITALAGYIRQHATDIYPGH